MCTWHQHIGLYYYYCCIFILLKCYWKFKMESLKWISDEKEKSGASLPCQFDCDDQRKIYHFVLFHQYCDKLGMWDEMENKENKLSDVSLRLKKTQCIRTESESYWCTSDQNPFWFWLLSWLVFRVYAILVLLSLVHERQWLDRKTKVLAKRMMIFSECS